MRRLAGFVALLGLLSSSPWPAQARPRAAPSARDIAPFVPSQRTLGVRHIGDFEPVDVLAVVHHWEWAAPLRAIVAQASRHVPVRVLAQHGERLQLSPSSDGRVRVLHVSHDSPWIRDYGPIQISYRGHPRWLDPHYAFDRPDDDAMPRVLGRHFAQRVHPLAADLDGGALVSNGQGLCAISDRNLEDAGLSLARREPLSRFLSRLGCRALSVLPALPGEPTGHADMSVHFFGPATAGVAWMDPRRHPVQAAHLDRAAQRLQQAARRLGQTLQIVRVPMSARAMVFRSYLNGLRVGPLFFVPRFGGDVALEREAHAALRRAMPGIRLVPVPADVMSGYGGAVHCLTLGLRLGSARARRALPAALAWLPMPT